MPLYFGVFVSLFAYLIGMELKKKFGWPVLNPLLVAIILVIAFLKATGITYTECDLDTYGADSRGPCRLVFGKENGEYRYYYTADHYSSFSEVYIDTNGEVTYR